LAMAFVVGAVMSAVFREVERGANSPLAATGRGPIIARERLVLLGLVLVSLLAPNYVVRTGAYLYKVLVW
ncbi:MAG: permease, partial [Bryobacteraceae bacterium]